MTSYMLSIDLEDWFQVENFRSLYPHSTWNSQDFRVRQNTYRLLELLSESNIISTFFVLGWVAEKCPVLIREIASEGHEVASHGFNHELINKQNVAQFKEDIIKSKVLLEDIIGKAVYGYRAPSFSITDWAIDALMEADFKYDSSVHFVVFHDRYGKVNHTEDVIYKIRENLIEIPVSTLKVLNKNLPWGGGGYFRLMPVSLFKSGIRKIVKDNGSYLFYCHPWEIDSGQPRVKEINLFNRFRHYIGISKTQAKLKNLINTYSFDSIINCLFKEGWLNPGGKIVVGHGISNLSHNSGIISR